jgi:hypothetical protein
METIVHVSSYQNEINWSERDQKMNKIGCAGNNYKYHEQALITRNIGAKGEFPVRIPCENSLKHFFIKKEFDITARRAFSSGESPALQMSMAQVWQCHPMSTSGARNPGVPPLLRSHSQLGIEATLVQ